MTSYEYSGVEPTIDIERIHANVLSSNMTNKSILGCTLNGTTLNVDFDTALSAPDEMLLDAIVAGAPVPPANPEEHNFDGVWFEDEFLGQNLRPEWATSVQGGGSVVGILNAPGGQIAVTSGGGSNRFGQLSLRSTGHVSVYSTPALKVRCKPGSLSNVEYVLALLWIDDNNHIVLRSTGGNWFLRTKKAGSTTDVDTGVAASTGWKTIELKATPVMAKAFIEGVAVATSTTNIPTGLGTPQLKTITTGGVDAKSLAVDVAQFYCTREV